MLNSNSKTPPSYEQILSEIRDLKDDICDLKDDMRDFRKELNGCMDRIETRIDRIENEFRSSMMRNEQIMTGSVVGIALAVIYFVFTH